MSEQEELTRKRILLVATVAAAITPFMGSSINLAIPAMIKEFRANVVTVNWLVTSFLLMSAAFLLPFGRLADLRGRRKIFLLGVGLFTFSSLALSLAPNLSLLLAGRVVQGMGGAMLFSTGMAIVTNAFPPQERGRVLGINSAAVYVGLALGPILGGFLTHYLGWRSIFLSVAFIGLFTLLGAYRWVPEDTQNLPAEPYDLWGSLLVASSLTVLIFGASNLTAYRSSPYWVGLGILGLVAFAVHEYRTSSPLLEVKMMVGNPAFVNSNLAAFINYMATFSSNYLVSLYLQIVRGLDPEQAGLLLLVQPVVQASFSPWAGKLSDRLQPRVVASLGMGLCAAVLFGFSFVGRDTNLALVEILLVLLGFGFALFASPNSNAVMSSVERQKYGVASSTLGTMRLVGQAMSMALVSIIMVHFLGQAKISPAMASELLSSIKCSYLVFALICALGVPISWTRGQLDRARTPEHQP